MRMHVLDMLDVSQRSMVEEGVIRIVKRSFAIDAVRAKRALVKPGHPTRDEVRRRTRIVYTWVSTMRNDFGYSIPRCLDVVGDALRASLDGIDYSPAAATKGWTPSKG